MSRVTKQRTDERKYRSQVVGGHSKEGSKDTFSRRWGRRRGPSEESPEVVFTGLGKRLIVEGKKAGVQEAHTVL